MPAIHAYLAIRTGIFCNCRVYTAIIRRYRSPAQPRGFLLHLVFSNSLHLSIIAAMAKPAVGMPGLV